MKDLEQKTPFLELPYRAPVLTDLFKKDTKRSKRESAIDRILEVSVEHWIDGELDLASHLMKMAEKHLYLSDEEWEIIYE